MAIITRLFFIIFLSFFYQVSFSQNHAPIAVNDTVECMTGQSVEVNVLLNDYDPDGDTIMIMGQSYEDSTRTISIPILYNSLTGYKSFPYIMGFIKIGLLGMMGALLGGKIVT